MFSEEVRHQFARGEPLPILAFALAALFILIFRFRALVDQAQLNRTYLETATIHALAEKFLYIRDRMNTPLQTLSACIDLLKQKPADERSMDRCQRAVEQLNKLNQVLKQYEAESSKLDEAGFRCGSCAVSAKTKAHARGPGRPG